MSSIVSYSSFIIIRIITVAVESLAICFDKSKMYNWVQHHSKVFFRVEQRYFWAECAIDQK